MLKFLILGAFLCQVVVNDVSGQTEGETEFLGSTEMTEPPIDDPSYASNPGTDEVTSFDGNQQFTGPQGSSVVTEPPVNDFGNSLTQGNDDGSTFQTYQGFSGTPDSSYALMSDHGRSNELQNGAGHSFNAKQQFFYLTLCGSKSLPGPGKKFPPGYDVSYGIGAHKMHTREVSWYAARKICIEEGGHLAIIRSAAEERILLRMMLSYGVKGAYVGYHDGFGRGEWTSVLDEPLARLPWKQWSRKCNPNPNNYPGQHYCTRLWGDGGGLDGISCKELRPFICKMSLV